MYKYNIQFVLNKGYFKKIMKVVVNASALFMCSLDSCSLLHLQGGAPVAVKEK